MSNTNKLINQKSPYLLQHATNPVLWHAWDREALQEAKSKEKIIFLSIGYSTCHWCHVMERESFENPEIAKIMNTHFINIKVDREERPDIDKTYMTFVQTMTGHGGWPLSVWLTPTLKPIYGGTYFPPFTDGRYIGFKDIMINIAKQWNEDKISILNKSSKLFEIIENKDAPNEESKMDEFLLASNQIINDCYKYFENKFDNNHGGFSYAPKFPQPVVLDFLFYYLKFQKKENSALKMITKTLDCISLGGIYDHLGNGFHRYSVDNKWKLPHFEKMLYDQAQLISAYSKCYASTGDIYYKNIAENGISYIVEQMTYTHDPENIAFFSAEDADSLSSEGSTHKNEGTFYVWGKDEIDDVLSPIHYEKEGVKFKNYAEIFNYCYGVKQNGNIQPQYDIHGEFKNKNVLALDNKIEILSQRLNIEFDVLSKILKECQGKLLEKRNERPRPFKDTKIITSWNGLMVSALCTAGILLDNAEYIGMAKKCALFIQKNMMVQNGQLIRSIYYDSTLKTMQQLDQPIQGFLDDYAFYIYGLLDLYEATFDETYLKLARNLQNIQNTLFWDDENGGYFINSNNDHQLLRVKEEQDGAEPSGNSISANNLIKLSYLYNEQSFKSKSASLFKAFSQQIEKLSYSLPKLTIAYHVYANDPSTSTIIGDNSDKNTRALLKYAIMNSDVTIVLKPNYDGTLKDKEHVRNITEKNKKPTLYLCHDHVCLEPVNYLNELKK
ncbi:unnamed protein product [Gordionus sp. m RMFG-2023]